VVLRDAVSTCSSGSVPLLAAAAARAAYSWSLKVISVLKNPIVELYEEEEHRKYLS